MYGFVPLVIRFDGVPDKTVYTHFGCAAVSFSEKSSSSSSSSGLFSIVSTTRGEWERMTHGSPAVHTEL